MEKKRIMWNKWHYVGNTIYRSIYYTIGGEKIYHESLLNFKIYPNPSRDVFNLSFTLSEVNKFDLIVTNSIGQEIIIKSIETQGEFNTQIDLSDYSKGVYNLTLITSNGIINQS